MAHSDVHQDRACTGPNEKTVIRAAQRHYSFEHPQFLQHTRGVGPKHHARAHFAKFVRPFVDRCIDACAVKGDGRGHAADSTTDDADIEFKRCHLYAKLTAKLDTPLAAPCGNGDAHSATGRYAQKWRSAVSRCLGYKDSDV